MSKLDDELEVWIEAIRQMQWMGAKIKEIQVDKETILRLGAVLSHKNRRGPSSPDPKTWYDFPDIQIHGVFIVEKSAANEPAGYEIWDD